MLFEDKKLQLESIDKLIQCPVYTIEPFALMLAPAYVLMKLNQKLVSVKAPLDFFTDDELQRLKTNEVVYFPKFVKSSVRFQTAARLIKKILTIKQSELSPASFEISKESFSVLSELWGKQIQVEPFFMAIFADEFCKPLDQEKMLWARENAVIKHDNGLLLSGASVFMALHLGWYDIDQLNEFRKSIYERTVEGEEWLNPKSELELIVSELNKTLKADKAINLENLKLNSSEWSNKLAARLQFLKNKNTNFIYLSASIYGEEGFAA
jgi:hypothetical protein